jgi:hypothetical protein
MAEETKDPTAAAAYFTSHATLLKGVRDVARLAEAVMPIYRRTEVNEGYPGPRQIAALEAANKVTLYVRDRLATLVERYDKERAFEKDPFDTPHPDAP